MKPGAPGWAGGRNKPTTKRITLEAIRLGSDINKLAGLEVGPASAARWRWQEIGLIVAAALIMAIFLLSPQLAAFRTSESIFPPSVHSITEMFAIVVSMLIFAVAWNAYRQDRPGNIVIIACGFLCVGLLDMAHTLSYKGMPDFVTPASPQKAIVFWLAARYVTALTFLWIALRP